MAAGSADAFSTPGPPRFPCYDRELDNLWSSGVVATASTGASWVDEVHSVGVGPGPGSGPGPAAQTSASPTDSLEKRIEDIRRKFHRGRGLQIKHLPREVTEEEVRELLTDWDVQSVTIQSGSGRVSVCTPELLEDWDRNAVFTVRGQRVTIVPSPTEMLLCIGRLPLSYNEAQFSSLVASYGEVRRSFLMISERSGENKGYGFVEYVTKEAALQAKNALDGKRILEWTAVCDWLDSSHVTLRSLHSKCLYVDRLPPNYRDMGEFRRVFSSIVNPPYCQIALKNGCPQDWGLVEFIGEEDAEKTQQNLDGYILHGSQIRVAYYIPGVRAINLYLKLLNDGGANKGKSALLPDPPAPAVFQQLQSLAKQNPVFAQNLQTIIMQQIQDLQKGKPPPGLSPPDKRSQYSNMKGGPFVPGQGQGQGQGQGPHSPPSANLMKNAQQTALTLLLASQMQQQNMSSIQNQQLLAALQAMSGGGGKGQDQGGQQFMGQGQGSGNLGNLLGLAGPDQGFYGGMNMEEQQQWGSGYKGCNQNNGGYRQNGIHKTPLLPSPCSGLSSPSLEIPMDTGIATSPAPPGSDSLSAVWYSLFGQGHGGQQCSSPSLDSSNPTSPGNSSPLFMKSSAAASPIGRSADALFGNNGYKSSPPGFSAQHGHGHGHGAGSPRDLQEALNTLLNNPQNFGQIFAPNNQDPYYGGRGGQRQGSFSEPCPNAALLDLLMASMKGGDQHINLDQQQQHQQQNYRTPSWGSDPPSPIGRGTNGSGFLSQQHQQQQSNRSGSNGSSEMSPSPSYSPLAFSHSSHSRGSGNANVSPTLGSWSMGSPPSGYGNIWASPPSNNNSNNNNNNLINPLGIKRKVESNGEANGLEASFLGGVPQLSLDPLNYVANHSNMMSPNDGMSAAAAAAAAAANYADSYFKKKKKN